ncbi:uncharacterized protein LOC134835117 [Culicoides brevitarsis]|uniref:uncharacterized protein LOC134835117 n=1 Tax=Culicoides brevitarsis TaxID=469753 RepID=UPI00307C38E6
MGHIIIDIEGPSQCSVQENNSSMLQELETEVYQNGFLAGYVFADMSLYQSEAKSDVEDPYLQEVEQFVTHQYQEMLGQVEKTFKKAQKLSEVIQYSVKNDTKEYRDQVAWREMDQVFGILLTIYKQLSPCLEIQKNKDTKEEKIKGKDQELMERLKRELKEILDQSFNLRQINENTWEVSCLVRSLPKVSQTPIVFYEKRDEQKSNPFSLNYSKTSDQYSAQISSDPSQPLILAATILLTDELHIPILLHQHPSS